MSAPSIGNWKLSAQAVLAIHHFFDVLDEQAVLDFGRGVEAVLGPTQPSVAILRELMKTAAISTASPELQQLAHALMRLCMVSSEFIVSLSEQFIGEHQNELSIIFGLDFYEAALAVDERPRVRHLLNSLPVESAVNPEHRQQIAKKLLEELTMPLKLGADLD